MAGERAERKRPAEFELTVRSTQWLTPAMVRVVLGGPEIARFVPNGCADAYVKLLFGTADEPVMRTYTVRRFDPERGEIAIDFVVHGDDGVAGPWAAGAQAGDTVRLRGPGGAFTPSHEADWYLFAGDESALPAIAASLEVLPDGAVGQVFLEVADSAGRIPLRVPDRMGVHWLHRGADGVPGQALAEAVLAAHWPPGEPQVFVHGEAQSVMKGIRGYIRKERGVPADRASISGYWRRGRTEEGFRVWKRELAAAEGTR